MVEVGPCRQCIQQHFAKRYFFAGLFREYRTSSQKKETKTLRRAKTATAVTMHAAEQSQVATRRTETVGLDLWSSSVGMD